MATKNEVVIVDYGLSNLASIRRALEECRAHVTVTTDPSQVSTAAKLVLPGVGAFADGMRLLHERGLYDAIRLAVLERQVPILGICLGMQLLANTGTEHGHTPGLGLVPGTVVHIVPPAEQAHLRVPHVGWNSVHVVRESPLFVGIAPGVDFYFVHSYHLVCDNPAHVVATAPYGMALTAAVQVGQVFGTQFHPEKSLPVGFQLLRNFVEYAG
jgi:imidazole glycerol-phosphate synthase subunit HisH